MIRSADNPETRELAQRLLAYEGAAESPSKTAMPAVFHVCDKLRRPLSTLAGVAGFRSLLARALAMAKHEAPILGAVKVQEDGSLQGMSAESAEAGDVLVAHLIGLMTTFIGEPLTLRFLHDVWPDLPGSNANSGGRKST